jgi:hypothetical protein
MKANNILIHKIDKTREFHKYVVVRSSYRVPNIGYHIKLWDFDFACIPGIVDNIKVEAKWTKKINVTPEQNRYYDIHYFFNTLMRKGFFPQILTDTQIPQELKQFIDRIVPKKYQEGKYVHKRGRILIKDEYLTPNDVLMNDPFFEEFRTKNKDLNKDKRDKLDKQEKMEMPKKLTRERVERPEKSEKPQDLKTVKSAPKQNKPAKKYDFDLVNLDDLLLMNSESS